MIGTRVTAHLWNVSFSTGSQSEPTERLILTGDPTGSDIYERVREVLEDSKMHSSHGLRLHRCVAIQGTVKGRAIVRTELMS